MYLLIPHSTKPYVLLLFDQNYWVLPEVDRPETGSEAWHYQIESLNQGVRTRFGLDVTVLRCVSFSKPDGAIDQVYVLENHSSEGNAPTVGQWIGKAELLRLYLAIPAHRDILNTWFREVEAGINSTLRRPWAQVGWLSQAIAWIYTQIDCLGLTLTSPIRQVRTWERSCVLQVNTSNGRLYFKAVPDLFAHEFTLTQALEKRYPAWVPRILCLDSEQGWALMADIGGQSLDQIQDMSCWQLALRQYAELQIDLADSTDQLAAWGCPKRPLEQLAAQVDPLLVELSTSPQGLSPAEMAQLYAVSPQLRAKCAQLASYRIPHTLEHGDFHARNIRLTNQGPVYFDWSDSAIAHPFFSLSLFFRSIAQEGWFPSLASVQQDLCHAYLEPWTVYEPIQRLMEAFELAQTLEVLHHAITYQQILLPSIEDKSHWAGIAPAHLRTLLTN